MSNFIKKYGILICLVFLFLPVNKVGAGLSDYKCCPALKQVKTDYNWETTKEIIGCKYSADNKCVYKANDELCTGRTIYSSAGGIGPRTTKGCDGPSFYVTWDSTPVACFENSLCLSQVPSYKPDAINWSLPNGLHSVTIGEKVDVFVEVEAEVFTFASVFVLVFFAFNASLFMYPVSLAINFPFLIKSNVGIDETLY